MHPVNGRVGRKVVSIKGDPLIFRRLIGQPVFSVVMASIGVLILLQGSAQLFFGAETRPFPRIFPEGAYRWGPLLLNKALLIGSVLTIVMIVLAVAWLTHVAGLSLAATPFVGEAGATARGAGFAGGKSRVQRIRMAAEAPNATARRFESKSNSSRRVQGTGSNPPG